MTLMNRRDPIEAEVAKRVVFSASIASLGSIPRSWSIALLAFSL
jgi:hypothetical protein